MEIPPSKVSQCKKRDNRSNHFFIIEKKEKVKCQHTILNNEWRTEYSPGIRLALLVEINYLSYENENIMNELGATEETEHFNLYAIENSAIFILAAIMGYIMRNV